ncbi:multi-sensor signal transduction histidine kinase [Crinalium epipsammum PCC 9333]|uniref:histidine kinase n=1 Tax=Crinalium epipsammum PCC 9333 TaxID=1173022 RepID=K9W659_9CYAN|nr:ATP-binding protein [Crinalium epipsammum]AFZ15289.1 multi-sensor signal transduction histidine kinase [Crinalium epipsammum PCC 9333]
MIKLLNFLTESPFIPHGHCYLWKPGLVGLHIISDSLIALAYYSIPITLLYFVRKREDLPFNGIFLLFIAFIFACGTTHLMEVWTLWHPNYWIAGLLKAITAVISAYTAVKLIPLIPLALALQNPAQLEAVNVHLKSENATRKLVEGELRKSEERFWSSFDNAATGLALADLDGHWFKVNRYFCNIVGYSEEELLGMNFQSITHPDDVDTSWKNIHLLLNGQANYYHQEKRYIHKDGHIVWIVLSKSLMRETFNNEDDDQHLGKPLYFIAQIQNITERKIAEEELHKALEKEKELSELKSRFITMASHEFRTPLATIYSSSDLLKSFGHKFSEERKLQHLNKIQTQVKNMTLLLEDVLFMGKVEAGKLSLNITDFNLEVFCREIIDEISFADRKKHKLLFEIRGECSTVEMDCKLMRQILTNLVSNAFKYSPEGAIIQVNIICNNQQTIINVQDQGIGIPISEQHHLFEIFHRASNVGNISGTGLGLAIVKQAVELHQGRISFESEVGVGTSFTVSLPTYHVSI